MRNLCVVAACVGVLLAGAVPTGQQGAAPPMKWYKGNTHTHTLNSDGDSTPDDVARWYREQKYQFLVLTDHNMVTPVDGLNGIFAAPERFLVIHGEEVTDAANKLPVHVNMLGGHGTVAPQGGATPEEALLRDVAAVRAAGGLSQINHPNFGWALTGADLGKVGQAQLIEVFNGHPTVNNLGGGDRPGAEALWDTMLSAGITVYGVASDDMHDLKRPGLKQAAAPGRGWVVVRAAALTQEAILGGLASGAFYASTGVELSDVQVSATGLVITIKEQSSTRYSVQFIGAGGRVLKEATTSPARYDIVGTEGYVRARITDSNGLTAWTQPVRVAAR